MSNVRQELPAKTSPAATHERRVYWNSTEVSLRTVPVEVPPEISSRSPLKLETWNNHATLADAHKVGEINDEEGNESVGK